MTSTDAIDEHVARLHAGGLIDMHFDLPLGLYWNRERQNVIASDFLPEFAAGDIRLVGAAVYLEDRDLPNEPLRIALDQVALLHNQVASDPRFLFCRNFADIRRALAEGRIGFLLAMEGAEPLGEDLHLLRIFYEVGLRAISLTHARENAAGAGGAFAPSGSSPRGLTAFGRDLVAECERLGILLDLAHINPAGFDEIVGLTSGPLIVSHSNARHFYDIERNISDAQIKAVGARGGVIGVNAILVSAEKTDATLDRYVDHIEYIAGLIGIDGVGIGFDFCEFLWRQMPAAERTAMEAKLARPHFLADLSNHAHTRNLTHKLIERGFADAQIEKILRGNWLRILERAL
ncbi:MAG: membrane dipeptidase [Verrucomicrobiota bacterium]|nr:membrane dipeptidase [Verrucomicrobiota bacterium]